MKRYRVIVSRPAADDLEHYYLRAIAEGAVQEADRWLERIERAISTLEDLPESRALIHDLPEFEEPLYQLVFEGRYRVVFTVRDDEVHVLCVRGPGLRGLRPGDVEPNE